MGCNSSYGRSSAHSPQNNIFERYTGSSRSQKICCVAITPQVTLLYLHSQRPRPHRSSRVLFRTRERRCEGPPRRHRRGSSCLQFPLRAVIHHFHPVMLVRSRSTRSAASRSCPDPPSSDSSKKSVFTPSRWVGRGASARRLWRRCSTVNRARREREEVCGQEVGRQEGPSKSDSSREVASQDPCLPNGAKTSTHKDTKASSRFSALPGLHQR